MLAPHAAGLPASARILAPTIAMMTHILAARPFLSIGSRLPTVGALPAFSRLRDEDSNHRARRPVDLSGRRAPGRGLRTRAGKLLSCGAHEPARSKAGAGPETGHLRRLYRPKAAAV